METKQLYEFVDNELHKGFVPIRVTNGEFSGLKFIYGKIQFNEIDNDEENLSVKFDYDVIDNPKEIDLEKNRENITKVLGDILVEVLLNEMEEVGDEGFLRETVEDTEIVDKE